MIAVAIDGPAGAGKSTIAKAAAARLGYIYVDTGALYRAIALFALEQGIDPADEAALAPRLGEISVELVHRDGEQRVLLGGRDVSEEIRRPEIGIATSRVSAIPQVRAFLLELQRDLARRQNVIMDGRDIGTVVLPRAAVKIYLTATADARATRRWKEHLAKGQDVSYNQILTDMQQRDYNDSHREIAPLQRAVDAVLADTSQLDLEASVELILQIIKDGVP